MNDPFWFNKFDILFDKKRLFDFWPTKFQSFEERVNALTRFILYAGIILSSYQKDTSPLVMALLLIVSLALFSKKGNKVVNSLINGLSKCQQPTSNNPLANRLPYDSVDRLGACDSQDVKEQITSNLFNQFPQQGLNDFNKNMQERQFFSNPNTDVVNDQSGFASWLYGAPNRKMCKADGACDLDPSSGNLGSVTGYERL